MGIIYSLILFQLVVVAAIDFKTRKIKNYWVIMNLIAFMALLFWMPEQYPLSLSHFFYPIGFLIAGVILFALKVMGAGDSKYIFSLLILTPKSDQQEVLLSLMILTIIVGLGLMIKNIIQNRVNVVNAILHQKFALISSIFGRKFPYAPIILGAWIFYGYKTFYTS